VNLSVVGCSFKSTPVALRERLAFSEGMQRHALTELVSRYGCEAVILSTCNRVELYLARPAGSLPRLDADLVAEFLAECHKVPSWEIRPHLYAHADADAVRHLFRVAASLDSLIVGEGQIAGQVKKAYEFAAGLKAVGPFLHGLFQHARVVAKRVRRETGISQGRVSVSSAAVESLKQVFDHFRDKTVLVIGAGKMAGLTLKHLRELRPQAILVTNRSPEKAVAVAAGCGGVAVPWSELDDSMVRADIILSTTGAPEPVVTLERWRKVLARRSGGTAVVLDIAVPRDFDPRIHDGDRTCLFNVDDLQRIIDQTVAERMKHVGPATNVVEEEMRRFCREWARKRNSPLIQRLHADCDAKRDAVVKELLARLNGKLSDDDRKFVEGAFRRLQNQILHGPISALTEESHATTGGSLVEALRKLFRLGE
jgi:glutamyl-tRNA reductase